MNYWLPLLVIALAVARGTRLVVEDVITEPFRRYFVRRFGEESMLAYLVHCRACCSTWVGLAGAAFACLMLGISWWWLVPLAFAFSTVALLVAQVEDLAT